jgi:hypothetical protein
MPGHYGDMKMPKKGKAKPMPAKSTKKKAPKKK